MKKKKHSRIWAVAGIILLGIVAAGSIYSHFGGFGTGPCADTTAVSYTHLTLPTT